MRLLLHSKLTAAYQLLHVDLADRRGISHVDKPDLYDVGLFVKQWVETIYKLVRTPPAIVYLAVSQSSVGFLRDSLFALPSWLLGARVILHLHGGNFRTWYGLRHKWGQWYIRLVLKRAAHVIVLGDSLRAQFLDLVPAHNISIVPNGIAWPSHAIKSPSREATVTYRILHLSTLNRLKGALVLIQAIPLVLERYRNVEFVFAGPWSHHEDEREAANLIKIHNIGEHITFAGPVTKVDQKHLLYLNADIFVFPGVQQEGQPLVVLEAMAAGLPVIFTNRGTLRETVIDGEGGLEARLQDPQHLAAQILWLLDHPVDILRMGKNARSRFQSLYTEERFIENMTHVFTHVQKGAP